MLDNDHTRQPIEAERFLAIEGYGKSVLKYQKNQVVFHQGEPADSIFYIREGQIKVAIVSEQGKEAIVALYGNGDLFGLGCLLGLLGRSGTAAAMTESVVIRFERAGFERMIHDEPELSERFTTYLLARNARVRAQLIDRLLNSSEIRLARLLLQLAKFEADGNPGLLMAKLNQEALAEMVGTTRSRINFFMNKFRQLGYIEYRGDANSKLKVHGTLSTVLSRDPASGGSPHFTKPGQF